jgi:hypothetical protein
MSLENLFIKVVEATEPVGGKDALKFSNPIKAVSIEALIADLLQFVTKLGAAVVVMMVIYSGFLFVKAQGDPAELEKAKKTFLWTVIGGVILLGAAALAEVIKNTARDLGVSI